MKHLLPFLLLSFSLILFGCQTEEEPAITYPASRSEFYFSGLIDSKKILIEDGIHGFRSDATSQGTLGNGYYVEEQSLSLTNSGSSKSAGFVLVKTFGSKPTGCNFTEGMFRLGSYTFGHSPDSTNDIPLDGVVIYFTDNNGKYWSSDLGTGNQSGSMFRIVEHYPNSDGSSQMISKAQFSCNLYDGLGNVKTLMDGEAKGRTVFCNF
ncbi:hypothetical protein [Adhaeribacter soli]|uniref:Lipoprotein n=1 Tax=Adhaeribacter soli TaxID=2607655 RepID=A0A5N1J1K4_9BACT|nr:hypothetical protein [Adhaeribacter soli]KAA9339957.1 hypothetical protein F0P94_06290 [Adhaeribacter soli]